MHARYSIGGRTISAEDDLFQTALNPAYSKRERPLCVCRNEPIPMYIARIDGRFYIKRMPNSGATHDPMCTSYEPPLELSGLGHLVGNAITEDGDEGGTTLRVAFSLSRRPGRGPTTKPAPMSDTVKVDASKLTLRSTLHYLWDQAGFNRWSPRMEGKRTWAVVRHYLLAAAQGKKLKGQNLADLLYVPEAWTKDHSAQIKERRDRQLSHIGPTSAGAHSLMLSIGECKAIQQTAFGYKLVIKHAPDFAIYFPQEMHQRIQKRFEMEIGLKESMPDTHLMFIATFGLNPSRGATLDELALMTCSKDWIPFDGPDEALLVQRLVEQHRHFVKGLRYNLPTDQPLASGVLLDTLGKETALYVVPAAASERYREGLEELQAESALPHWTWNAGESTTIPALPPLTSAASPPAP
jgi:hypothetical protein